MNNDMLEKIINMMIVEIRVVNITVQDYDNHRNCPFFSEVAGMERVLKMLGIDFEYEYDNEYIIRKSITVNGKKYNIE